jgi:molybdopterin converting factor small subunit
VAAVYQEKVKFYSLLLEGAKSIEDVSKLLQSYSGRVSKLEELLYHKLNYDPNHCQASIATLNGLQLKLLSLFKSTVLNDFLEV